MAVGRILVSGRFSAIFTVLEFAGLLYLMRFAGKSPGYASFKSGRPTSVHRRGMGPASSSIHISANYVAHSVATVKSSLRKN